MPFSGVVEGIPYSLSRYTDLPASKWGWFQACLASGKMVAFDPRTLAPGVWSLRPEDTLGLVFWTKNPTNLIRSREALAPYDVTIHMTATGWSEVEKGAPSLQDAGKLLIDTTRAFPKVHWRFSPVPLLPAPELFRRFQRLLAYAEIAGLKQVFLSFLQPNDRNLETRGATERFDILNTLAAEAKEFGIGVVLCGDDTTLEAFRGPQFELGACVPPQDFRGTLHLETCGCVQMADPFTTNESCCFGCTYCLGPDTPILYSDLVWRPIGEAKEGDCIVGFDEYSLGVSEHRKLREAVIEAVVYSKKPSIRLVTKESELFTTAEHKWLNDRGKWIETKNLWFRDPHPSKIKQIGWVQDLPVSDDYRLGYLSGMSLGDGTFRYQSGQRSHSMGYPQAYWRVALKDEEPLGRLVAYLGALGVESHIRPFDSGPNSHTQMQKVEIRALGKLAKINDWIHAELGSQDYRRGFLAGFYDAEGSMEGSNLRMFQKDREVLTRVSKYSASLGFNLYLEKQDNPDIASTARLSGTLVDRLRYLATIKPALARKAPEWNGAALEVASNDSVVAKERSSMKDVVDIQTSTGTFFAAGLATHNCYAADKKDAPRKRNTMRRLEVVRA